MEYNTSMTTLWKYHVYFFVRASDNTAENRQAFAQIYADCGWMEPGQIAMFDSVHKFSMSGELPAQVYGLSTPAMASMRDAFKAFLDTLDNGWYAVTANTTLPGYADGELILTNIDGLIPSGQIVDWDAVKTYLFNHYGLIEIIEEEQIESFSVQSTVSSLWDKTKKFVSNLFTRSKT